MKIAKLLFEKLGFTSEEADKFLSSDEAVTKDLNTDEIYKKTILSVRKKLEDDGTIESLLEDKVKGKIAAVLGGRDKVIRQELKDLGIEISDEDYTKLPEKDRTDQLIKLALKKLNEKKASSGDDAQKEMTELRNKLQELADAKKKLEEEELPKAKTEAEKQIAAYRLEQMYQKAYGSTLKGKLIADEDSLFPAIDAQLRATYDIGEKDGKVVLFKKGTTTVAFHENSNKEVKLEDALTTSAAAFIKKQEPTPPKKGIPEPGAGAGKQGHYRTNAAKEKMKEVYGDKAK
jgi:hypothetical protein